MDIQIVDTDIDIIFHIQVIYPYFIGFLKNWKYIMLPYIVKGCHVKIKINYAIINI